MGSIGSAVGDWGIGRAIGELAEIILKPRSKIGSLANCREYDLPTLRKTSYRKVNLSTGSGVCPARVFLILLSIPEPDRSEPVSPRARSLFFAVSPASAGFRPRLSSGNLSSERSANTREISRFPPPRKTKKPGTSLFYPHPEINKNNTEKLKMAILSTRKSAKCPPRLQSGASIPNNCTARANRRQSVQLSIDFDEIDDRPIAPPPPLSIKSIPPEERIHPDLGLRLVHAETGLRLPGQFSFSEIEEIFFRSIDWDWSIDKERRPACYEKLLALLERVAGKDDSGDRPVRAIEGVRNV